MRREKTLSVVALVWLGLCLAGCCIGMRSAPQSAPIVQMTEPAGPAPAPPAVAPKATPGALTPTPPVVLRTPTAGMKSSAPPPQPNPAELVREELSRLAVGRILYNPPEQMAVAQRERVEVRITQSQTAPLAEGLKGSGAPRVEQIGVSSFMRVRLIGDGFNIMPLSSEEQAVVGEGYTQWAWDVTPQRAGDLTLVLIVTARVKMQGYPDEQKDLQTLERHIKVRVNPAHAVSSFVGDNRDWLIPSVLIPLAMWVGNRAWRAWRGRARGQEKSD